MTSTRSAVDLDLAGREARVLAAGRAPLDGAVDLDDVFVVQLGGDRVRLGRGRRVDRDLDDAGAVAQVDEDQAAVVAHAVHPALEHDARGRRRRRAPRRTAWNESSAGRK